MHGLTELVTSLMHGLTELVTYAWTLTAVLFGRRGLSNQETGDPAHVQFWRWRQGVEASGFFYMNVL